MAATTSTTPAPKQRLSFDEVVRVKSILEKQNPELKNMSVPDFAALANQQSERFDFSAGLEDTFWKRVNRGMNLALYPVAEASKGVFQGIGDLFGEGEMFGRIGEALPRGLLELLPTMRGYRLLTGGAGLLAGAKTAAPGVLSHFTQAKANLEGTFPALVETAGFTAIPPMAAFGGRALPALFRTTADTVGGRALEIAGREASVLANQLGTMQATSLAATGQLAPLDKATLTEIAAGQLPFAILDIPYVFRGFPKPPVPKPKQEGPRSEELPKQAEVPTQQPEAAVPELAKPLVETALEGVAAPMQQTTVEPSVQKAGSAKEQVKWKSAFGALESLAKGQPVKRLNKLVLQTLLDQQVVEVDESGVIKPKNIRALKYIVEGVGDWIGESPKVDFMELPLPTRAVELLFPIRKVPPPGTVEPQTPSEALTHLERWGRQVWLKYRQEVDNLLGAEGQSTLVQAKHPVFGEGTFLREDLERVNFREIAPGRWQVFVGDAPTDFVRVRGLKEDEYYYLPKSAGDEGLANWSKPQLTVADLKARASAVLQKASELQNSYFEVIRFEKERILNRFGVKTEEELAALTAVPKKVVETSFDKFRNRIEERRNAGGALLRQFLSKRLGRLAETKTTDELVDEFARDTNIARETLAKLPSVFRIYNLRQMARVVQSAFEEAFTLREPKRGGEIVMQHPALKEMRELLREIDKQLHRFAKSAPIEIAADRAYNALVTRAARITKALVELGDKFEANIHLITALKDLGLSNEQVARVLKGEGVDNIPDVPKKAVQESVVLQQLQKLETAVPWGEGVLNGAVRFLNKTFNIRGRQVDIGMMGDTAVFRVLQMVGDLADEVNWKAAVDFVRQKTGLEIDPTTPRGQELVAFHYLQLKPGLAKTIQSFGNRVLLRFRLMEDLVKTSFEELGEVDIWNTIAQKLGLTTDPFKIDTAVNVRKSEVLWKWFTDNFVIPPVKDAKFWGDRTLELVQRPNGDVEAVVLTGQKPPRGIDNIFEVWNRTLSAIVDGKLELDFRNGALQIRTPDNPEAFLNYIKFKGNWRSFAEVVMPAMLGRMRYKLHEWTLRHDVDPTTVVLTDKVNLPAVRESIYSILRLSGVGDEMATRLANVAMRVAMAFKLHQTVKVSQFDKIKGEGRVAGAHFLEDSGFSYIGFSKAVREVYKKDPAMAVSIVGHEFAHAVFAPFRKLSQDALSLETSPAANLYRLANSLTPEERAGFVQKMMDIFLPSHLREFSKTFAESSAASAEEFLANVTGIAALGHTSPIPRARFEDFLFSGTPLDSEFARGAFISIPDLFMAMKKFHDLTKPVDLVFGDRKMQVPREEVLDTLQENLSKLFEATSQIEKAAAQLDAVRLLEPTRWYTEANKDAISVMQAFQKEGLVDFQVWPEKVHPLVELFFPSEQLAAVHSKFQGVFDVVRSFRPIANTVARKVLEPILVKRPGTLPGAKILTIDENLSGLKVLLSNENAERAASKVALIQQVEERALSDGEIQALLQGESREVVDAVINWEHAARQITTRLAEQIVNVHEGLMMRRLATIQLREDPTINSQTALQRAEVIVNAIRSGNVPTDPTTVFGFKADATFADALEYYKKLNELKTKILNKPWYRTEMRFGRFMVAWRDPSGKPGVFAADSKAEIDAYVEKLKASGATRIRAWDKHDRQDAIRSLAPDFLETLSGIEDIAYGNHVDALVKKFNLPQTLADELREGYIPLRQAARDLSDTSIDKFLAERKLRPGREDLNMVLGTIRYVTTMSHLLAKKVVTADFALAMASPQLRGEDNIKRIARDHFNNVVNPSAPELSTFKKFVFFHTLAFNTSQMMIELTQPLSTVIPQFIADVNSISKSYKVWGEVLPMLVRFNRTGKTGDAVLDKFIKQALDEQVLDFGVLQEVYDIEAIAQLNLHNAGTPTRIVDAATYWTKSSLGWLFRLARDIYGMAPRLNALTTFMASYKLAKDNNLAQGAGLYDYAKRTTLRTLFGGGTAARPVGLFARKGELQGVVGLMYSLQTFTFSTLAMYARFAQRSLKGDRAAMKALGDMLVAQGVLGGFLSQPFAGAILAVADQLFPELEVQRKFEETAKRAVARMFGDEAADFVSDMALRGVSSAVFGIDLTNRIALSNLLGVSPYDGFSWENFLGPAGSILGNMFRAVRDFSVGDVAQAARRVAPTFARPTVEQLSGLKTRTGEPLLPDMKTSEQILHVLGFRPKRLADVKRALIFSEKHDEAVRSQITHLHRNFAARLVSGEDPLIIRHEIEEAAREFGPLYNVENAIRSVVDKAVEMRYQFDPSRSGMLASAPVRHSLARGAGIAPRSESEVWQQKRALEAAMGLLRPLDIRSWFNAALVDNYVRAGVPVQLARQLVGGGLEELWTAQL